MRRIKSYKKFFESNYISTDILQFVDSNIIVDIDESLNLFYEDILKSIDAEEVNIFSTFDLSKKEFKNSLNLDVLNQNVKFIQKLSEKGLKNSALQSSEDLETFVNKPCRFVMIYRLGANELENPLFILFQSKINNDNWENTKLYSVNSDIKSFYDKLSSKVIEITHNGKTYIYQSSNKNEWTLKNLENEDEIFKKDFRKEDFEKFINDNKFEIRKKALAQDFI